MRFKIRVRARLELEPILSTLCCRLECVRFKVRARTMLEFDPYVIGCLLQVRSGL